jgi:hypothetical protein
MLLVANIRKGWEALLAGMPRPLLARLDAWARDAAEKRVERRMKLARH